MRFKKLVVSLFGLGTVAATVGTVVACGKTANATLPVEFVIAANSTDTTYAFRTDRNDGRLAPGIDSWYKTAAAKASAEQAAFQTSVAPGIVSAFKAVLAAYVGNYDDIDPKWKPLFDDAHSQRSGSGSVMVEMSRIYMANVGELVFAAGQDSTTGIKAGEKGTAKFTVTQLMFDGYATTGNSPAESYDGLLKPADGHHWVIDFAAVSDPIVLTMTFTNQTDKAITSIAGINFGLLDSYVICASKLSPQLTQDEYRAIVNSGPSASNYYKGRLSDANFKKIFGATVVPAKVTT